MIFTTANGCNIGIGTGVGGEGGGGGGGGWPSQYFILEILLTFIHAAQIAVSQCILCLASQKWNCFLRQGVIESSLVL